MFFKTHKENIKQIRAVIATYGQCYFHGCGNFYDKKEDSDFRKDFTNPGHNNTTPASAYRVHFTSKNQVPDNVEDLNALLQKSFAKEQVEASKPKSVSSIKTISVDDDNDATPASLREPSVPSVSKTQAELDEEEFQRLLKEEGTKANS
jgi:hypothetical protein